jgi:Carboxypeptidase regulatory-like domain
VLSCWAGAKKKPEEAHAVVAGTVFRDPGFALPGAKVVLTRKDEPKARKLQTATNFRGEFAFEVPPEAASYVVTASHKGFQSSEKEVMIGGDERVDVTLSLAPESKK